MPKSLLELTKYKNCKTSNKDSCFFIGYKNIPTTFARDEKYQISFDPDDPDAFFYPFWARI